MDASPFSSADGSTASSGKVLGMTGVSLAGIRPPYRNISGDGPSSPAQASPSERRKSGRNGLSLLLTSSSSFDSIEIPPSLSLNDDSTVSSFGRAPQVADDTCCFCGTLKQYLVISMVLSLVLFIWCCAVHFIFGAFLGLIALGVQGGYLYTWVKGYAVVDARRRRRLRALHVCSVLLTVLVVVWLVIRLCSARTYIHGRFPSSCYRNALRSVPPACVRVVSGDSAADYAHGLTAPVLQTSSLPAVAQQVQAWAQRRPHTRRHRDSKGNTLLHFVTISGFWGFVDDLVVLLECEDGGVVVRMQSEQRLGTLDAGTNKRRVTSLLQHLASAAESLPSGTCGA